MKVRLLLSPAFNLHLRQSGFKPVVCQFLKKRNMTKTVKVLLVCVFGVDSLKLFFARVQLVSISPLPQAAVVLILQFAGFQLKPHIRSFPDTQCAVAELYLLFVTECLLYFCTVKPSDHISQGGL